MQYANGNSAGKFFYKEYIKGERRYKSKEIVGALTIEQAKELAPQVAIELAQDAVNKPSLTTSIDPLNLIAREEMRSFLVIRLIHFCMRREAYLHLEVFTLGRW